SRIRTMPKALLADGQSLETSSRLRYSAPVGEPPCSRSRCEGLLGPGGSVIGAPSQGFTVSSVRAEARLRLAPVMAAPSLPQRPGLGKRGAWHTVSKSDQGRSQAQTLGKTYHSLTPSS